MKLKRFQEYGVRVADWICLQVHNILVEQSQTHQKYCKHAVCTICEPGIKPLHCDRLWSWE